MELNIIKNTESAPSMGSTFGQDVEPKGTYVREKTNFVPSGWIEGKAIINKPLIIPINDETLVSWKYEVSDQFKAKGKKLTNKLMAMGFDAIITRYPEGDTGEIILFPNCKFIMSENNTKSLIKKMLKEALIENRELGKSLASQIKTPYVTIYRAAPMEANEFYDRDYVTLSKKFAVEHAENNHVYHEEPYHVIEALVSTSNVFNASNPGEYFYSGPNKKAREIYISKGPYDYEGYDEISENEDDYRGSHRAPNRDNDPMYDLENTFGDDVYTPNCVRYFGHGGGSDDAFSCSVIRMAKGKPDQKIKIYRAVPKGIETINAGDWVTISPKYAKSHGSSYLDGFKVISMVVTAKDLFSDGNSIHEWGFDPQ